MIKKSFLISIACASSLYALHPLWIPASLGTAYYITRSLYRDSFRTSTAKRLTSQALVRRAKKAPQILFAHGLGGNKDQVHYYLESYKNGFLPAANTYSFNFIDAQQQQLSSLAQTQDIRTLQFYIDSLTVKYPVLCGVSRGASTIITACPQRAQAIILESPFDEVQSVIQNKLKDYYLHWIPGATTFADLCASCFFYKNYSTCGIRPIDVIDLLPKSMPILIICSREDQLIPPSSSIRLYKKLIETEHAHAYLLVTFKGSHANILWGEEGATYQKVAKAFYKKFVTYNPTPEDEQLLATLQPDADSIEAHYNV